MKKKAFITSFVIAIIFALCAFPALAATSYNASAALSYAQNHWDDGDGECAEFARKCVNAGGCPVTSNGCSSMVKELKGSKFSGYGSIVELKIQDNGYISLAQNKGKLSAGDLVFYYCGEETDGCPYVHVVLFSGDVDSDGDIKAYAHHNARNNESIGYKWCGSCGAHIKKAYAFHFNAGASSSSISTANAAKTKSNSELKKATTVYFDRPYYLRNRGTGMFLNVFNHEQFNGAQVDTYPFDGTPAEMWFVEFLGNAADGTPLITLAPAHARGYRLNVWGYSSVAGSEITLYEPTGSTTQSWLFCPCNGGVILKSYDNAKVCLSSTSTEANIGCQLKKLNNSDFQIWEFYEAQ